MISIWLLVPIFLWFVVPAYISWKYDTSPKDVVHCVQLAIVGDFKKAQTYLNLKEDPEKPIHWYFWVPFLGRFFIHFRDLKMHPELHRELWISLVENTILYFIVGLIGGYFFEFSVMISVLSLTFFIIIPIEYKLTLARPKLFLSDGEIDYVEYLCVFIHAYFFAMIGTIIPNIVW